MTFICPITDMDGAENHDAVFGEFLFRDLVPSYFLRPNSGPCRIRVVVCDVFGISLDHLMSRRRLVRYARPRQACYLLYYEYTGFTYPQIGRLFDRDHSTIMYGIERALELLKVDVDFRDNYAECEASLKKTGVLK